MNKPFIKEVMNKYPDHFPDIKNGIPKLSRDAIRQYQEFGEYALAKMEKGDFDAAEVSLKKQINICDLNPAPHLALMKIALNREQVETAVLQLREAVIRGFLDFRDWEQQEEYDQLCQTEEYKLLTRAFFYLAYKDQRWSRWDSFETRIVPDNIVDIHRDQKGLKTHIDNLAPVLGDALTEKWRVWVDCAAATLYASYITEHSKAEDIETALERLLELYSKGKHFRWRVLSYDTIDCFKSVSKVVKTRFPDNRKYQDDMLMAEALIEYSKMYDFSKMYRYRRPQISQRKIYQIRQILNQIISDYPETERKVDAYLGLIKIALSRDEFDEARNQYNNLMKIYAHNNDVHERIEDELGFQKIFVKGLPDFTATTLNGRNVTSSDLKGKIYLLDFWATWCVPCLEDLKKLRKLYNRYDEDQFEIIGISLDDEDFFSLEMFQSFLKEEEAPWTHIYDGEGWESSLAKAFSVKSIPFTVLVDHNGFVRAVNLQGRDLRKKSILS